MATKKMSVEAMMSFLTELKMSQENMLEELQASREKQLEKLKVDLQATREEQLEKFKVELQASREKQLEKLKVNLLAEFNDSLTEGVKALNVDLKKEMSQTKLVYQESLGEDQLDENAACESPKKRSKPENICNESDRDEKSVEKDEGSDKEEASSDDEKSKEEKKEQKAVKGSDKKETKRGRKPTKASKSADQDDEDAYFEGKEALEKKGKKAAPKEKAKKPAATPTRRGNRLKAAPKYTENFGFEDDAQKDDVRSKEEKSAKERGREPAKSKAKTTPAKGRGKAAASKYAVDFGSEEEMDLGSGSAEEASKTKGRRAEEKAPATPVRRGGCQKKPNENCNEDSGSEVKKEQPFEKTVSLKKSLASYLGRVKRINCRDGSF